MIIASVLAALVALGVPAVAAAHGTHGGPPSSRGEAAVTSDRYQIEIVTRPSPLVAGETGHLAARIVQRASGAPVSGGRVAIAFSVAGGAVDATPAPEETWAGSYTISVTPDRAGPHRARVVVAGLEGTAFAQPLVFDLPVSVESARGLGAARWALLAAVAGVAAAALYAVSLRARLATPATERLNLLAIPWLRGLMTSGRAQTMAQLTLLAATGVIALIGFHDVQDGGMNLATKLTWTIWWAGVIFTFVLVGRVWCVACPFGALNEWMARLAAPVRRLPRPFRNIWWATAAFVLLTWADEQLGVVRSPRVTAWLILGFAAAAIAVGLAFERRSFCRYLCPIGGMIGVYAMTAPLELRARDAATCRADRARGCYRGSASSRGCPMFEYPQAMDRNNYCTLCGDCVKGCGHDNLVLRVRALGKDLWHTSRRVLDEAYLAVVLVGLTLLVTAQMLGAWPDWMAAAARWLPSAVRTTLKPVTYLRVVESIVLLGGSLVATPLLVLGAAAVADRRAGPGRIGVRRTFVAFGYMLVPVALAMHLAHNAAHLLLEGGGIVPAVQRAVALYTPWTLGTPDWQVAALAAPPVVSALQMAVIVGFFVMSLAAGHRIALRAYPDARSASRALLPMVLLSLLFTVAGIVLLSQPMGARHGM